MGISQKVKAEQGATDITDLLSARSSIARLVRNSYKIGVFLAVPSSFVRLIRRGYKKGHTSGEL